MTPLRDIAGPFRQAAPIVFPRGTPLTTVPGHDARAAAAADGGRVRAAFDCGSGEGDGHGRDDSGECLGSFNLSPLLGKGLFVEN